MDPRNLLSALMGRGGGAPVGADEYQQLIAREMARYHGDRDAAVRSANVAGGFGNSTAQRFMHEPAAAAAAAAAAPIPAAPDMQQTASIPMPRPTLSPDLAVSPPHERDPMAASAPTNAGVRPQMPPPLMGVPDDLRRPPPMMPSPDLAVSPPRPDNSDRPAPTGNKRGRLRKKGRGQYTLPAPDPARFGR